MSSAEFGSYYCRGEQFGDPECRAATALCIQTMVYIRLVCINGHYQRPQVAMGDRFGLFIQTLNKIYNTPLRSQNQLAT